MAVDNKQSSNGFVDDEAYNDWVEWSKEPHTWDAEESFPVELGLLLVIFGLSIVLIIMGLLASCGVIH